MKKSLWATVVGLIVLSSCPVWAKPMVITDRIEVAVRSGIGIEQKFIATIKTGDRVEVLESDQNWSKVKLPNGAVGWVASRFLVDQLRTPQSIDPKVQEEIKALKDQNLALVKQSEGHKQEREKLLQSLEEGKRANQVLQQQKGGQNSPEFNQIKARNEQLERQINEYKQQAAAFQEKGRNQLLNERILWFLAGSAVLFIGLILGWLASRGRKKTSRYY